MAQPHSLFPLCAGSQLRRRTGTWRAVRTPLRVALMLASVLAQSVTAAPAPALETAPGLIGPVLAVWQAGPAAAEQSTPRQSSRTGAAIPGQSVWWSAPSSDRVGDAVPRRFDPGARAPLGSLWKLFVYVYLDARDGQAPSESPYRCGAGEQRQPDDNYCCEPGQAIGRDEALVRSCGPYFAPDRLGLSAAHWSTWWRQHQAPPWLQRLDDLQPQHQLAVADILSALAAVPDAQRERARAALLPLSLADDHLHAALGSGWRFKTWSSTVDGARRGGAAGWLVDGRPFWFGAPGTSRTALQAQTDWLRTALRTAPPPDPGSATGPTAGSAKACVDVAYFNRYPVSRVTDPQGRVLGAGPLPRRVRIEFDHGTRLALDDADGLWLQRDGEAWQVNARLDVEDYVARVVDREGQAGVAAAARALAVAARSYLLQNAGPGGDCLTITDDSRQQRVSPRRASAAARQAAADTRDVVLLGQTMRYRLDDPAPGVLAWQRAVEADHAGLDYVAILREAFPAARFAPWGQTPRCDPWPAALDWLRSRERLWQRALREARLADGFEAPGDALQVCRLAGGPAHADPGRMEIHVRDWQSLDGRTALIHEYLHLAYRAHPRSADEPLIELWAQRLAQR